jgi:hypothetical protein
VQAGTRREAWYLRLPPGPYRFLVEEMAAVGTLAAGVGHELNNPLSFVSSNLHSPGAGTTFEVLLPLAAAPSLPEEPPTGA